MQHFPPYLCDFARFKGKYSPYDFSEIIRGWVNNTMRPCTNHHQMITSTTILLRLNDTDDVPTF